MIRLVALALAALLIPVAAARAAQRPEIASPQAIVVDAQTGDVAFSKDADTRRPIASTTKLMTALLTLEHGGLKETVTAPRYRGAPAEIVLGLSKGEKITEADLLRALLVISANDAAVALATHVAGSVPAFVERMNERAQQLGLSNTSFANPIGLDDPQNYSSARDLAKLTRALRKYRIFRRTVGANQLALRSGDNRSLLTNRNTLLAAYPWIDGVKTGYTSGAGDVLVASGTKRKVRLISVVLGASSRAARNEESVRLLNFGFTKYRLSRAVRAGKRMASVPIRDRPGADLPVIAERSVRKVKRVTEEFTYTQRLPEDIAGPVSYGQRVGKLEVRLRGRRVATVPLIAALEVPKASAARRTQDLITQPWTLIVLGALLVAAALLSQRRSSARVTRGEGGSEA